MKQLSNEISSLPEVFYKKGTLKIFPKFAGKHVCWSLLLINLTARPATLLERDSTKGVSTFCEFFKIFRRTFLQNTSWRPMILFFSFLQINQVCSLKAIYLMEQCYMRKRNSQTRSILCSYGNQVGISLTQWLLRVIQRKRRSSVTFTFIICKDC